MRFLRILRICRKKTLCKKRIRQKSRKRLFLIRFRISRTRNRIRKLQWKKRQQKWRIIYRERNLWKYRKPCRNRKQQKHRIMINKSAPETILRGTFVAAEKDDFPAAGYLHIRIFLREKLFQLWKGAKQCSTLKKN